MIRDREIPRLGRGWEAEARAEAASDELVSDLSRQLPNNFPFVDAAGTAATYSSAGFVDLDSAFHVPQGTNGRSCESCHLPQVGWSIKPLDVEILFWLTDGTAPIFNLLDANSPNADVSTTQARYASYSMLRKGLFRRGGTLPASDVGRRGRALRDGSRLRLHEEGARRPRRVPRSAVDQAPSERGGRCTRSASGSLDRGAAASHRTASFRRRFSGE